MTSKTARQSRIAAGPPAATVDGEGQRRYRKVALVLVEIAGTAESAEAFDAAVGRVNPDLWEPLEYAGTELQVACDDGYWHRVLGGLWGETIDPERGDEAEPARQPLMSVGRFAELGLAPA